MRIEHFMMDELENLPLEDKFMAILTDIQELAKQQVEKSSNVLVNFILPTKTAFEDFLKKEGKTLAESTPRYYELANHALAQKIITDFSLGAKKTDRQVKIFERAFSEYKALLEKKINFSTSAESEENGQLDGFIANPQIEEKIKDLTEFIYIYRYNKKDTTTVLNFLHTIFDKKHGAKFLQRNLEIYQAIEVKVESLIHIGDKTAALEALIENVNFKTIDFYVIFYWFYARGELKTLIHFLQKKDLPIDFRDYILELIQKRADMRSTDDKIFESTIKAKQLIKDVIGKLNGREIPVISKKAFEKLLLSGHNHFPDYFESKVMKRIKDNVYHYIKSEKMKDA